MPSGMVYLIRAGDLYKIGITRNLAFRIRAIGIELKMSVWLLRTWPTRTPRAVERYIHSMFSEYRLTKEWFRLGYTELERLRHIKLEGISLPPSPLEATAHPTIYLSERTTSHRGAAHVTVKEIEVDAWEFTCEQCGHLWIKFEEVLPDRCPKEGCRSKLWNDPSFQTDKHRGRPRRPRPPTAG